MKFKGAQRDCMACAHRDRCLLTPQKTKVRQVSLFQGKADGQESYTDKMKARIDSPEGRQYGQRFATVKPVFGNLRHNKQLNRFTLRGRNKVDAQWKLYCLVHNIEKLAHHGYAQYKRGVELPLTPAVSPPKRNYLFTRVAVKITANIYVETGTFRGEKLCSKIAAKRVFLQRQRAAKGLLRIVTSLHPKFNSWWIMGRTLTCTIRTVNRQNGLLIRPCEV